MTPRAFGSCETRTCASFVYVASVICPANLRMSLARDEDKAVLEQRRRLVAGRQTAVETEDEIRATAGEVGRYDVLLPGAHLQVHARRFHLQSRRQARKHHGRDEVVRHDREIADRDRGIEGGRAFQALLQREETGAQWAGQRERALGRDHAAGLADQQRIFQHLAQLRERVAHRRLRQAEARAGAADAALGEEGVEDGEQVQVQRRYIHVVNIRHHKYPFAE